jgi:predicted ester cyclase
MLNETQLQNFAARYTAAWNSGNSENVAAFFTLRGTLSVNGALAEARPAIALVAQSFMTAFPDLHLQMDKVAMQSESAVYHWTFAGTHAGPGGTGNKVCFSGQEIWKFAPDGLIAESQGQFDAADYRRQLAQSIEAP